MKITILFLAMFSIEIIAQVKYKITKDEKTNLPMLIGVCDRSSFSDSSFSAWWNEEYEYYAVDTVTISSIKSEVDDIKLKIVMGTWCSDSRREVPHLFKILDYLNFSKENYEIITVDRKKNSLTNISELKIELIPTIIVYKEEKEIGRIIEAPKETLELDLAKIIAN